MMRSHGVSLSRLVVLTALLPTSYAQALRQDELCVQGCFEALSGMEFSGTSDFTDGYYVDQCTNLLRIQSIYLCSREHCSPSEVLAGVKYYNDFCEFEAGIAVPSIDIIANYSPVSMSQIQIMTASQVNFSDFLSNVVLPSKDFFSLSYETVSSWNSALSLHVIYSWALYAYWAIVVIVGMSYRLGSLPTQIRKASPAAQDIERIAPVPSAPLELTRIQLCALWVRKCLSVPATFGYRCAQPLHGWGRVPPRLQSIAIWAFALINLILCSVSYYPFEKSMYFSNYRTQIWRMVSDRAGILAFANLPLLWLFSSRNNVLIWITGWHYETFNRFHRWIARIATLEAIIHSVGYTGTTFFDGGKAEYIFDWTQNYWVWGVVATILMSFLCVSSTYCLRTRLYETFLYLHIVFAVFTLIGCFYHVAVFDGVYIGYLWPCVAIWVFDRCVRFFRLGYLNHFSFSKGRATYYGDSNIIHLEVWPSKILPNPRKGSHYFLYVLNNARAYESHPFTLASWEYDHQNTQIVSASKNTGVASRNDLQELGYGAQGTASAAQMPKREDEAMNSRPQCRSLRFSFLIRPRDGFTARLRDQIIKSVSNYRPETAASMSVKVLLEGPYGGLSLQLENFRKIVLVVGGSGMSLALSYLQAICDSRGASNTLSWYPSSIVHVIWAVQHSSCASTLLSTTRLAEYAGSIHGFSMDIFVTRGMEIAQLAGGVKTREGSPILPAGGTELPIRYHNCRPDIVSTVLDHTHSTAGEKMGVISCGPPQMADDCRLAVVRALQEGYANVELIEESFGW